MFPGVAAPGMSKGQAMKLDTHFNLFILLIMICIVSMSPLNMAQQIDEPGDGTLFYAEHLEDYPEHAMWSSDSQQFSFLLRETGPARLKVNTPDSWVNYTIGAQTLTYSLEWQLQPELTPAELQFLDPGITDEGHEAVRFESPSGEYIVCLCGGITIYSRTQQQFAQTGYPAMDAFHGPDHFYVYWSEDESAFVFNNLDEVGDQLSAGYVTNYALDISDTTVLPISPLLSEGKSYELFMYGIDDQRIKVHDLSSDGQQVLLTARHVDRAFGDIYLFPYLMIVWDTTDPDNSIIIQDIDRDTFMAASFVHGSDEAVLILTTEGLFHYDLATEVKTLLPLVVGQMDRVHFSPDGKYLALTCCRDSDYSAYQLQIIDLTQIVDLPNPRP
jgi:hypothetical protein